MLGKSQTTFAANIAKRLAALGVSLPLHPEVSQLNKALVDCAEAIEGHSDALRACAGVLEALEHYASDESIIPFANQRLKALTHARAILQRIGQC